MVIDAPPRIYIDDDLIAGTFTRADLAVLAGLAWTWGRSSIYDAASPAQLTLSMLDPNGEFASQALTGRTLRVVRGDNRTVFRGRINDQTAEPIQITPEGRPYDVWLVELTASDKIAEAGQTVLPGPGNDPAGVDQFGPHYWPTQSPTDRIAALEAAGARDMVRNGIIYGNPYGVGSYYPLARYREFADKQSVLAMLEALYAAIPLAYVEYDANSDYFRPGLPAAASGLALTWDGQSLDLDLVPGLEVLARDIVLPAGRKAETAMDAGIDVVQVTVPKYGPTTDYEIVDATTETRTARFDPENLGRKALAITTDIYYNDPSLGEPAWQQQLAEDVRDMVDDINGMLKLPPIRLHFGIRSYDDELAALALDTRAWPTALYFAGSIFNVLQAAGAAHQIIGGTVTWTGQHWLADCTLAPAVGQGATLRFNQLVTIDPPEWQDFAAEITFADLGNVTQGVSA